MNIRKLIGIISTIFSAVLIVVICYKIDQISNLKLIQATAYNSLEEAGHIEDPWIIVPAAENKGLEGDVCPVSYEEGDHRSYLILPESVDATQLVYYVMDTYDNCIARVCGDVTDGISIQGKDYVYIKSALPFLFFTEDENSCFVDITTAQEDSCEGVAVLSTSSEQARKLMCAEQTNMGRIKLTLRGAFSRLQFKKSYTITLEKSENLLGFGKNKKYNLVAELVDVSHLKNATFLNMARELGLSFTPRSQHVILYANKEYQGIYLLTTKVKVGKNNVALKNGDYFYNLGTPHLDNAFPICMKTWVDDGYVGDPMVELIYPEEGHFGAEQKRQAMELFQAFIDAIEDTESDRYLQYIDMESFAKYYWIQEISMNYDAYCRSMYIYYDSSSNKMFAGPIWDLDESLGNRTADIRGGVSFVEPYGWKIRSYSWWGALCKHDSFMDEVEKIYYDCNLEDIMKSSEDYLTKLSETLMEDGTIDMDYWYTVSLWLPETDFYGAYNYREEVTAVKDFYSERINWIMREMQL